MLPCTGHGGRELPTPWQLATRSLIEAIISDSTHTLAHTITHTRAHMTSMQMVIYLIFKSISSQSPVVSIEIMASASQQPPSLSPLDCNWLVDSASPLTQLQQNSTNVSFAPRLIVVMLCCVGKKCWANKCCQDSLNLIPRNCFALTTVPRIG